jgi:hypothetical protein
MSSRENIEIDARDVITRVPVPKCHAAHLTELMILTVYKSRDGYEQSRLRTESNEDSKHEGN